MVFSKGQPWCVAAATSSGAAWGRAQPLRQCLQPRLNTHAGEFSPPQGIDLVAGGRSKKVHRTAPKSDNVYLKLLVKVGRGLQKGACMPSRPQA